MFARFLMVAKHVLNIVCVLMKNLILQFSSVALLLYQACK